MRAFHIKENAWHYKLHNIVHDPVEFVDGIDGVFKYTNVKKQTPTNLCSYFWTTILCILLCGFGSIVVVAIAIAALVTFPIWGTIWGIVHLVKRYRKNHKEKNYKFRDNYIKEFGMNAWIEYERIRREDKEQPNMLWAFIKAKKAKACPLIVIDPVENVES